MEEIRPMSNSGITSKSSRVKPTLRFRVYPGLGRVSPTLITLSDWRGPLKKALKEAVVSHFPSLEGRWIKDYTDSPSKGAQNYKIHRKGEFFPHCFQIVSLDLDKIEPPKRKIIAYEHVMQLAEKIKVTRLAYTKASPFGVAGRDYSPEYRVTCTPLYK
jgi:hypothetical protein